MRSTESVLRICTRGFYSCYWKQSREDRRRLSRLEVVCLPRSLGIVCLLSQSIIQSISSQRKYACCWFVFLSVVSILVLGWMYICFVAYNDHSDVNWKAFSVLSLWVNWFMCVLIVSAVLATYCLLLLLFSLFQFAIKEPLDLHWLHKILLVLGLVIVILGLAAISSNWTQEWSTVRLSLQATAPFLQLGAVVALTMISWLVFQSYLRAQSAVSKVLIGAALGAVSAVVFLSPLLISSPCITDELPPKPALVGHRGAPVLAPENTMMSFEKSMECNVTAFETDVQLSNGTPFLVHDDDLRRTTNVRKVFPDRANSKSHNFTVEDLQTLNAGEWFLEMDPFWSVSSLSEGEKARARKQKVPLLSEILHLAKEDNISVIFDMKIQNQTCTDNQNTVTTILDSGISQDLIWWLSSTCRNDVKERAPKFLQVYSNVSEMEKDNGTFLNMKYSDLSAEEIRSLRDRNVRVNLWVVNERWLFSLLWCSGVSSVTTNTCHILKDMSQPDWHFSRRVYLIIWITADLVSLILMVILFLLQSKWCSHGKTKGNAEQGTKFSSWTHKELSPFLQPD